MENFDINNKETIKKYVEETWKAFIGMPFDADFVETYEMFRSLEEQSAWIKKELENE